MPTAITVRISIRAEDLVDVVGSMFNPFAVVLLLGNNAVENSRIIGKTEVIKKCSNPNWITTFKYYYILGRPAKILIKIFDAASSSKSCDAIFRGSVKFEIGAVLVSKKNTRRKVMIEGNGAIFTKIEHIDDGTTPIVFVPRGIRLACHCCPACTQCLQRVKYLSQVQTNKKC